MDFNLPGEDDPRRIEVRKWFQQNPNPSYAALAAKGYTVPHWPAPWGLSADPETQLIIEEEIGRAGPGEDSDRTERAVGAAMGTAGHIIVISGLVVLIALGALAIVDVPAVQSISLVVALTIATVMAVIRGQLSDARADEEQVTYSDHTEGTA